MAKAQWAENDYRTYDKRSKGGKLPILALAGLAAAAWANRDKIMAAFEKLKASGTSAASAGTGSHYDAGAGKGAHRADGSDDSASFAAGIADEGSIPNTTGTGGGMSGASF